MHHPTDKIAHTTAFVTPVVEHCLEREIAQWVHPMKDRSDDPSHHDRTLNINNNIIKKVNINPRESPSQFSAIECKKGEDLDLLILNFK